MSDEQVCVGVRVWVCVRECILVVDFMCVHTRRESDVTRDVGRIRDTSRQTDARL